MKTIHTADGLTWQHITAPSTQQAETIGEKHGLHLRTAEEILSKNVASKVDIFDSYVYVVLHFPVLVEGKIRSSEIDCIVTKKTLISISYEEIPVITDLERQVEANTVLNNSSIGEHAGYLLYFLLSRLYRSVNDELLVDEHELRKLEREIFSGNHREMVTALSRANRELLDINQILADHKSVLPSLEAAGRELLGDDFQYRLKRIHGEYKRVNTKLNQLREILGELKQTNDSLLTTRQNEVMKIFTIMAFLTFPLSLMASVFGMDTQATPIIGHPYDFWIIVGAMLALVVIFLSYFYYKEWL